MPTHGSDRGEAIFVLQYTSSTIIMHLYTVHDFFLLFSFTKILQNRELILCREGFASELI